MRGARCVASGLEPPRDGPGATQTAHAGAHRGSRQPHEASRGAQRHPDAPGSDFEAILGRFWGPQDLEKPQKVLYCQRISWFSRFRKGAFNRGPKSSKRSSPGGPNEPQARPGRPQERPKSPQDGSKSRPERAKRRPRPPRTAPGEHPRGPSRPDASREPFGSPFWPHLGAPGASFSSFLGVLFEPRARSARQTKALVEITGQKVFRDRCGPDVQRPLSTKLLN